jgi:hypothetical protein
MRFSHLFGLGILLWVVSSGCTPIADHQQERGETPQVSTPDERAQSSVSDPSGPVSDDGRAVSGPSSRDSSSDHSAAGDPGSSTSLPFIAEAKSPFLVIDLLSPGRLEIVDGCLTVNVRGHERATAVFPPGVKPELKGNEVVAVSFGGRTIPLDQEVPIPGGFVRLSSADLVKPIPSNCPKALFGL